MGDTLDSRDNTPYTGPAPRIVTPRSIASHGLMGYSVKQAGRGAPGAVQLWGERSRVAERTDVSSAAREARTMIIDDRLLPQTGASSERDGSGSETLAPGWDELAALAGESETDHHPATP